MRIKVDIAKYLFYWYLKNKKVTHNKINIDKIKTILIISTTAIGDTLFATPAINLIKKKYPDKKIIALLNPKNYQLFASNPNFDEILLYRNKWLNFIKVCYKLKKYKIDVTLIMNGNEPQATPLAYLVSKFIIRIPNNKNWFNFLHYNEPIARNKNENTINTRLKQLTYIGINEKSYQVLLYPKPHWYKKVDLFLKQKESKNKNIVYIGLQLGASTLSRMWFAKYWFELAQKLLAVSDNIHLILTGSKEDAKLTNPLSHSLNSKRVHNVSGIFSICEVAALIERLDLLITPDTGPLHIAAAMKTPTVAFSVAGRKESSNPIDERIIHTFIEKPYTCTPCVDKRCKNQFCMHQISVVEVFNEAIKILKK